MRKSRLILAALLVVTALTLFSCGPISSSKAETSTFTFRLTPEMADKLARSAGNEEDWCLKISVSVWKEADATTIETKDAWFTVQELMDIGGLQNLSATGLSFTVPINEPMLMSVDMYSRAYVNDPETLIFLTRHPQRFMINQGGETKNIVTAKISAPYTTPYLLVDSYDSSCYMIDDITSALSYSGMIDMDYIHPDDSISLSAPNIYCFDDHENIWFIFSNPDENTEQGLKIFYICTPDNYNCLAGPISADFTPCALYYDYTNDKVFVIISYENDTDTKMYFVSFDPEKTQEEIMFDPETTPCFEKNPYSDTAETTYIGSVNDNILYTLMVDDQQGNTVTVRAQSLLDGSFIRDAEASIPVVNDSPNLTALTTYDFNDLYADDDNMYVLFHQREIWDDPDSNILNSMNYYIGPVPGTGGTSVEKDDFDFGIIDRGGIIVLDRETSEQSIIGMPEVQDSMDLPVTYFDGDWTRYYVYTDEECTQQFKKTLPITWAIAQDGRPFLANPVKIVAITPKKLVIADSGVFIYEDINSAVNPGPGNKEKCSKGESRLVSIDLENFANSSVVGIFDGDDSPYPPSVSGSSYIMTYNNSDGGDTQYWYASYWTDCDYLCSSKISIDGSTLESQIELSYTN